MRSDEEVNKECRKICAQYLQSIVQQIMARDKDLVVNVTDFNDDDY